MRSRTLAYNLAQRGGQPHRHPEITQIAGARRGQIDPPGGQGCAAEIPDHYYTDYMARYQQRTYDLLAAENRNAAE